MSSESLGERLLTGRAQQQARQDKFQGDIQCGGGFIRAFYRALDFREDRKIGQRHEGVRDEIERELRMAADTLVASCLRCEAHVDGEVHELPPLGLGLAKELGLDVPENDRQVAIALFPTERALVEQFIELEKWASGVNRRVDGEIEENSDAATSISSSLSPPAPSSESTPTPGGSTENPSQPTPSS